MRTEAEADGIEVDADAGAAVAEVVVVVEVAGAVRLCRFSERGCEPAAASPTLLSPPLALALALALLLVVVAVVVAKLPLAPAAPGCAEPRLRKMLGCTRAGRRS